MTLYLVTSLNMLSCISLQFNSSYTKPLVTLPMANLRKQLDKMIGIYVRAAGVRALKEAETCCTLVLLHQSKFRHYNHVAEKADCLHSDS